MSGEKKSVGIYHRAEQYNANDNNARGMSNSRIEKLMLLS